MYHRFDESKYPSTNIQISEFEQQLEIIKKNKIQFVNPNFFEKKLLKEKNQRKILITIDDAFSSFYKNAWPLLKKKKNTFYFICKHKRSWKIWIYDLGPNQRN